MHNTEEPQSPPIRKRILKGMIRVALRELYRKHQTRGALGFFRVDIGRAWQPDTPCLLCGSEVGEKLYASISWEGWIYGPICSTCTQKPPDDV